MANDQSDGPLNRSVTDIVPPGCLSDEAAALRAERRQLGDFLESLLARGLYADATQTLAHAISSREAIWWLCQCIWHAGARQLSDAENETVGAAVRWVVEPTLENAMVAAQATETVPFASASRCLADAVGMAPPEDDSQSAEASARAGRTADLVGAGLLLSRVAAQKSGTPADDRQWFALGIDIANGTTRLDRIQEEASA